MAVNFQGNRKIIDIINGSDASFASDASFEPKIHKAANQGFDFKYKLIGDSNPIVDVSQTKIQTTKPCLEYLPFPAYYRFVEGDLLMYRPFLPSDFDTYSSFLLKTKESFVQGNPHFDLSNVQDRFQRILESSFTQGIHLGFFLKIRDEMVLVGEGGVYMPESNWPYIY